MTAPAAVTPAWRNRIVGHGEELPEQLLAKPANLDPLAALATAEKEALAGRLAGIETEDAALVRMLAELGERHGIHGPALGDPDAIPAVPEETDVYVQPGDLWQLGDNRLVFGDATDQAAVNRLLDGAEPTLLATDPPYGVSLDPTWRDGVHIDLGPAEPGYMRRTDGHRNVTLSGDTRVDWSDAFELVPSLQVGYVWHAGVHAAKVALPDHGWRLVPGNDPALYRRAAGCVLCELVWLAG